MNYKNVLKNSAVSLIFIIFTGCYNTQIYPIVPNLISQEIKITDKTPVTINVSNPYKHELEYKYTADRGYIVLDNSSKPQYYAPFTGGPDTIRTSVYDKTDKVNLPVTTQQVFVQGESVSYVELPSESKKLADKENGLIRVASVRGSLNKKDIGWGRTPVISPDGRYVAYVEYKEDGSSQIIVKDPIGNITSTINKDKSINKDPAWSPIGTDGNLYLVFSSNRESSNKDNVNENSGKFHLWRIHVNGTDLRQITKESCNDIQPSWSPDGSKIAFVSNLDEDVEKDYNNLFILDIKTGSRTQITKENMSGYGISNPSWSHDAQKIIYSRYYQKRLITMTANFKKIWMYEITKNKDFGQIVTREFDETILETYPSFSPDGRDITFVRQISEKNALVSLNMIDTTHSGASINLPIDPKQEGDINNITEASWARQRSYGYSYNNPSLNNPFTPGTGTYK